MSVTVVAGTFDTIHDGHKLLLKTAFKQKGSVLIGLTSDSFASKAKKHRVKPYAARKRALERFLGPKKMKKTRIIRISNKYGPTLEDKTLSSIVVSTETEPVALEINKKRKKKGLKPLKITSVNLVYAEDLKKIACTRIREKKITVCGVRTTPVLLAIGTRNPTKINGVKAMTGKIFRSSEVKGVKVSSKVPEQPFGNDTIKGAVNRAISAFKKTKDADYGIGLESGLFSFYGRHFDIQWCAVYDGENITLGSSMGFECPPQVVSEVKKQEKDMGEVFRQLTGIKDIGKGVGAIGFLSNGVTERKYMTEQAFLCAMIPRMNTPAYHQKAYK